VNKTMLGDLAGVLAVRLLHGLIVLTFTLLTLFFIYRSGTDLNRRLLLVSDRVLGERGGRLAFTAIAAVRGAVNGLVLVGLGEGILLGIAYAVSGVPHPALIAALTAILGVIPFGAPMVFGLASLGLLLQGNTAAAIGVFSFGLVLIFVADHFIRPVLIGSAARLPFLWVLLGILGGLQAFGLLGLFLGPAIMATLISLWRDWTDDAPLPPAATAS
jgi:predicted PurR-regulated permease PerM